jgi:hypothetical protein
MIGGMALSEEIKAAICDALAEGQSVRQIMAKPGMPAISTVFKQLSLDKDFAERYARAKEVGIEAMAQELLQIADTPQVGVIRTTRDDGSVEEKHADMIEHRRLRVDSRKWLLSKLAPKKYGDKTTIAGDADNPLPVVWPIKPPDVER